MIGTILASVLFAVILIIYHVSKRKFDYWEKREILYEKPLPFVGNFASNIFMQKSLGEVGQWICKKFPNAPYVGAFYGTEPVLLVQDPEIIKLVMAKDFYYFNGREISEYTHREALTTSIFFTYGDRWKVLRQNLTPLFTSSKMRNMFYLIEKCSHIFENMLDYECGLDNVKEIRMIVARFTMDCVGSCGFGIDTKAMAKDSTAKNNPFIAMGDAIFSDTYYSGLKINIRAIWPNIFYGLGLRIFAIEIDQFFHNLLTKVFNERQYKVTTRNDFIDLILNFKKDKTITGDSLDIIRGNNKKVTLEVDDEMLVSLGIAFFGASFETSATTLHFTFYELAKNQEAQSRVIEEVDEFLERHNNKLVYDCVTEMPYTEACIDEAMRLYPILTSLTREVMEPYKLPCGAVLDKGLRVHIPVYHMHHNPDYFTEPEEFRPERFLGEEKKNIKPFTYFPFGEGPRLCLGLRFAKMQLLAGIVTILKKYRLEPADVTPRQLQLVSTSFVTQPKEKIKLKFVERKGWQRRVFN